MTEEQESVISFGDRLRMEREQRQLSLEEISRVTKISIHLLHAMENDDWDALPSGDIFKRNFIRLYTNHLGLDAEQWVEEYRHYIKTTIKEDSDKEDKEKKDRVGEELPQGWIYALIIIAFLTIIIGGYYIIANQPDNSAEIVNPGDAINITDQPASQARDDVIVPAEEKEAGLNVEMIESNARCWFMWWADGLLKSPEQGENLERGAPVTLTAENNIRIHIAHLTGVQITVNGITKEWIDLNPRPVTNEEGQTTSYIVTILLEPAN